MAYPATLPKPPPNPLDHQLYILGVKPLIPRRVERYKQQQRAKMSPSLGLFLKDRGWGGIIHALGSALMMLAICVGGVIAFRDPSSIHLVTAIIVGVIALVLILQSSIRDLEGSVAEWENVLLFQRPVFTRLLLEGRVSKELMPQVVLDLINELHMRVPDATLWIEELGADPILHAELDGVSHALAIWDRQSVIAL